MGNGKKNKPGAQPKKNGRLVAALVKSQSASLLRAKANAAAIAKEERAKASASGATQAQMKKKRKAERAVEKEREREEEAARERKAAALAAAGGAEIVVDAEAGEGKGKRKREERDRKKGTIPYKLGQRVLLVGEGNFSFAHALLLIQPPTVTPHLLLATSFDTLEVAIGKYPDIMLHVDAIKATGAKVVFGVDATDLKKCREVKEGREWDKVAFNFPHVGAGITDQDRNIRANQTLILKFLRSVTPFLRKGASASTDLQNPIRKSSKLTNWTSKKTAPKRPKVNSDDEDDLWAATHVTLGEDGLPLDTEIEVEEEEEEDPDEIDLSLALNPPPPTTAGTVLITLRTAAPYSLWSIAHLGTRGSLIAPSILPKPLPTTPQPNFKIVRSFEFSTLDYPTYEHRRTIGFKEGVSSGKNEDLNLSARERGEKRREEKERGEKEEKEEREERGKGNGKEGRGIMRTWEMESAQKSQDDIDLDYD